MDQYQQYIATSRYARWLPEQGRRESWGETVQRYMTFWLDKGLINEDEADTLGAAILNLDVMPSMRCLMTAGAALERDNVAGFNCSYLPIDHPRAFDELMYILLCGTGVGFSVERQYVAKLPEVPHEFFPTESTIVVPDSKIGWAKSFRQLVAFLYAGEVPEWDVSKVRPAGAPLKTFGGRASGPQPLVDLFKFTIELFKSRAGKRLSSLNAHDLCCKIADVIVVGGVRRSALISLSNPSDGRLRTAKSGQWWIDNPQRALANNSACYTEKPEFNFFMDEMRALYESKSGERGVFSRPAANKVALRNGRREACPDFGTNPCSEIILRPNQFCNLSEVVIRADDTIDTLKEKVRLATILGTLQATLTDFRYLRPIWKKNTEEEALLGVSLTGIFDNAYTRNPMPEFLQELREVAIETNKEWSKRVGVSQSAAITCVKPSGTVSQLVNSASGIHPRFSPKYIRTVRADKKDPLALYMAEAGFVHEDDKFNANNWVFSFAVEGPKDSPTATEVGAMEQLDIWMKYQQHWCEHKPSCTVYYSDDEFLDVASWIWKNFDDVSGISFLPRSEHGYEQAPYQDVPDEEWQSIRDATPEFDWDAAAAYEAGVDSTTASQELACTGGACELP